MANEITLTSHDDVYLASEVRAALMEEVRPNNTLRGFMDEVMVEGSTKYDFPIQDDPGAAAAKTEATDMSNTAATTSKATITVGTVGIMFSPTDEARSASLVELVSATVNMAKRSVLEKLETDLAALLDDTTNKTTTSGVAATVDGLYAAAAALTNRDIPGARAFVGGTTQYTDLERDAAASLAAGISQAADFGLEQRSGRVIGGIFCSQTSLTPTANSAADSAGCVFIPGQTFGFAVAKDPVGDGNGNGPGSASGAWLPRVRTQRDESNNVTELIVTARYGAVLKRASDAQQYITRV